MASADAPERGRPARAAAAACSAFSSRNCAHASRRQAAQHLRVVGGTYGAAAAVHAASAIEAMANARARSDRTVARDLARSCLTCLGCRRALSGLRVALPRSENGPGAAPRAATQRYRKATGQRARTDWHRAGFVAIDVPAILAVIRRRQEREVLVAIPLAVMSRADDSRRTRQEVDAVAGLRDRCSSTPPTTRIAMSVTSSFGPPAVRPACLVAARAPRRAGSDSPARSGVTRRSSRSSSEQGIAAVRTVQRLARVLEQDRSSGRCGSTSASRRAARPVRRSTELRARSRCTGFL